MPRGSAGRPRPRAGARKGRRTTAAATDWPLRVGKVVEEVIRLDEADGTRDGRAAIAEALEDFSRRLYAHRESPDVAKLLFLAADLRRS
jgi:hypothetical protein